ncbi:type I restriction modification DNA specificity domain protein [Coriobacteriaceae bacterium BV3Ac1]|nr:type I restriction modification DNA specificity domain protein [Coriobacteriaceae bacterium BV3Ac1]
MREMKDSGVEWLGEVPVGWGFDRFSAFFTLRNVKVSDEEYAPLSVTRGGVVPQLSHVAKSDDHANRKLVCKGDFAINSRSDRRNSCGFAPLDGSVSLINTICVPRGEFESRYFGYLFDSAQWSDEFYSWGHGIVADLWTTGWNDMKKILLPVPPLDEQHRIADYLDEKCAEIDRAVSAAEQSIEEYKAYKNSVVYRAVTKGLDADAPMKDSGVEWLCEVPVGWGLRQVGQLADQTKTPNKGMVESNLLSLSYGKIKRRDIYATDGLLPASFETYNIIEPDDIVFRFTDLQNDQKSLRVGRVTERGIITSAYVTVRPFDPSCSRFLYYALHAYDLRKGFYGMGAGVRQGLKWQEAKYIKLPWPGNVDRGRIADYLDEKCSQIDTAIAAKQAIIADLKAYKQSLIYETVTGKREV